MVKLTAGLVVMQLSMDPTKTPPPLVRYVFQINISETICNGLISLWLDGSIIFNN